MKKKNVGFMEKKLDDQEEFSRKNSLLIHDLPENNNKGSRFGSFEKKVGVEVSLNDINHFYR